MATTVRITKTTNGAFDFTSQSQERSGITVHVTGRNDELTFRTRFGEVLEGPTFYRDIEFVNVDTPVAPSASAKAAIDKCKELGMQ